MNKAELNQISMTMIAKAGHAKNIINEILIDLENHRLTEAKLSEKLAEAHQELTMAHKEQNKVIALSDRITYSLLFTHAQDTLMNTEELLFITKHLVKLIPK